MTIQRRGPAAWAIHPGEILRTEFLEPMNLSGYRLAKEIAVPAQTINDIVREKRGISADIALRLARFFGTTEEFWMNLQGAYELALAFRSNKRALSRIKRYSESAA